MRIAFVVGSFPALAETFLLNQITGLMDAGCHVKIFAGERSGDTIFHEEVVRHGLFHHARYLDRLPSSRVVRFIKFLLLFPFWLCQAPGPVLASLNAVAYGREAWSLKLFFMVTAFLEARDYDVVFCHLGENGLRALRMKQMGVLKGKIVTVFQMMDLMGLARAQVPASLGVLFREGDLFLPVNSFVKHRLMELGCPERKILVHRMGVDIAHFDVSTRRRFGPGHLKILSVARLVEEKGLRYALEALTLAADLSCEYVIIGDGPLRPALEAEVLRLGLMAKVRFLGWQDSGTIRRYLKDTDIFLAPGVAGGDGRHAGIPVVLIEAMASGVPVVTTANASIRDLVEDGRTGFLVPEKDAAALAVKLRQLRDAPERVAAVTIAARQLIEEQYNIKMLNQSLLRILTNIIYDTV